MTARFSSWWRWGAAILLTMVLGSHPVPAKDAVTVFARIPDPGHPLGVAVDGGRVYVATSAGLPVHLNTKGERLFVFNRSGKLESTTSIETAPVSTMGLFGLALDGRRGHDHHLYLSDMNGRILRFALTPRPSARELYAEAPEPFRSGGWYASMWNDIVFDSKGNAYVMDDKPRLWRIPPNGPPQIWFEDSRLTGFAGFLGGPFGGRIGPDGKLYFTVTQTPDGAGVVYRLPLVERPAASDLEEFHRFPRESAGAVSLFGLTFGESGRLYVAMMGVNQITVLDRSGRELRRISSPLFASPFGVAFLGRSLLVANGDFSPIDNRDHWLVLNVAVGETGLRFFRPTNIK